MLLMRDVLFVINDGPYLPSGRLVSEAGWGTECHQASVYSQDGPEVN